MKKLYTIEMPDKSIWGVPVEIIARSRASFYAYDYNNDVELSLEKDTLPLFDSDYYEILDWAENNMNWEDVVEHAILLQNPPTYHVDYQEGWLNGEKHVVDRN